jgi:hypothetical protein
MILFFEKLLELGWENTIITGAPQIMETQFDKP